MERFIIGAAFATAAIFTLGSMFGGGSIGFSIDLNTDSLDRSSGKGGTPASATPAAFSADEIRFEDGFAVVQVIPEERTTIEVTLQRAGMLATPVLRQRGDVLIIDGETGDQIRRCTQGGVVLRDNQTIGADQAPMLIVKTPRNVVAKVTSAGVFDIAAAANAEIDVVGCGRVKIGEVAGVLDIDRAGDAEITASSADRVILDSVGSGRVALGRVAKRLDIDIAGSSAVTVEEANGDLEADLAGSGVLEIIAGALSEADITVMGSGDVKLGASASRLEAKVRGSGRLIGLATVGDLEASVAGSGIVRAAKVTGAIKRSVAGSGVVDVNASEPAPNAP